MAYTTALPTQPTLPAHARALWYLVARPVTWRGLLMCRPTSAALALSAASSWLRRPVLLLITVASPLSLLLLLSLALSWSVATSRVSGGTLLRGTVTCMGSMMVAQRSGRAVLLLTTSSWCCGSASAKVTRCARACIATIGLQLLGPGQVRLLTGDCGEASSRALTDFLLNQNPHNKLAWLAEHRIGSDDV